jgi:hypothetical protein
MMLGKNARWGVLLGGALAVGLLSADARADAMCGGPRRRPDPPPPQPTNSGFATPPPPLGALDQEAAGERVASRPPMLPVELGMLGCMVILGGAAGVSSRGKKGEKRPR